jgi:hypothetical protein
VLERILFPNGFKFALSWQIKFALRYVLYSEERDHSKVPCFYGICRGVLKQIVTKIWWHFTIMKNPPLYNNLQFSHLQENYGKNVVRKASLKSPITQFSPLSGGVIFDIRSLCKIAHCERYYTHLACKKYPEVQECTPSDEMHSNLR